MTTTTGAATRPRRSAVRLDDGMRAQIIADKNDTLARIDQLNRSLAKAYRRIDYLRALVPDES